MSIVHLVISLISAAAVLYYGYLFTTSYREIAAQPGDWKPWERLWAAGAGSATKLWARVVGIVGSVIAAIIGFAPMLGAPEVADFIKANFDPQTVTVVMIGIMIVTEYARNRTA
jgi:uncharacterized membrane protein